MVPVRGLDSVSQRIYARADGIVLVVRPLLREVNRADQGAWLKIPEAHTEITAAALLLDRDLASQPELHQHLFTRKDAKPLVSEGFANGGRDFFGGSPFDWFQTRIGGERSRDARHQDDADERV